MRRIILVGLCCLILFVAQRWFTNFGHGENQKMTNGHGLTNRNTLAQKCARCHQTYYDSWKDSHNKMIRPPIAEGPNRTVLADFNQPSPDRKFDLKDVKWVVGIIETVNSSAEVDGEGTDLRPSGN